MLLSLRQSSNTAKCYGRCLAAVRFPMATVSYPARTHLLDLAVHPFVCFAFDLQYSSNRLENSQIW